MRKVLIVRPVDPTMVHYRESHDRLKPTGRWRLFQRDETFRIPGVLNRKENRQVWKMELEWYDPSLKSINGKYYGEYKWIPEHWTTFEEYYYGDCNDTI